MTDEGTTSASSGGDRAAAVRRAAIWAAAGLLALTTAIAVRYGLLGLGLAVHRVFNGASAAELLLPAAGVFLALVAVMTAPAVTSRLGVGRIPWVVGLIGAAAIGVPRYLATILGPIDYDLHGVLTNPPSHTWRDHNPHRPEVDYRINRAGLRGADFDERKRPGVIRVATIGDSFIFGLGVEEQDSLAAQLTARLAEQGLAGRVEVLNLGIAGSNLPTHARMYDVARRHLDADVVVMGLFVWNDLAIWDCEDEKAGRLRVSFFSVLSWLVGVDPAIAITTAAMVQHGIAALSLRALDATLPRLRAARASPPPAPPIVLLAFGAPDEVKRRFAAEPDLVFIDAARDPENYLPRDGHPSAAGNRAFSVQVIDALLRLPALRDLPR